MFVLVALVGALILLTGFNLLLLFAVLRRLREIEGRGAQPPAEVTPAVGTRIEPWVVTLTDGTVLTDTDLGPDPVVLFLTPGCGPCAQLVRQVTDDPAVLGGRAMAVVVGDVPGAGTYADVLPESLPLTYVEEDGPVVAAFGGVDAFPTVVVVRGGVVLASSHGLHSIDALASV